MPSTGHTILALVLASEYVLGGLGRVSAVPFSALNERIFQKSIKTAPHPSPVFPFTDVQSPKTVRLHMLVVGALMITEGILLLSPATRAMSGTLGLGCFLTVAGAWSQMRAGLKYWLPLVNFGLAWAVWALD
ncbi:uncharacterized protein E0L32_002172 [Thyridium curvatum]|uniref:Uncharacterized protein n=1 Tax=Thyridium curvatum TaxID=1093900 RepID=A0A507AR58_9PEZI|nr:uncharacterized protein E0L32_001961 [Thyridium curvatum]XP_030989280.1 uncharacterized protein E0L32_002172 [Thyridium curvatum]TPX07358.1 hypothetical protein E0L32_001961 [Thyridium curvatum]TPX07569.1 hypothetical protein E0L32_002172 [Thyridium curvatum]